MLKAVAFLVLTIVTLGGSAKAQGVLCPELAPKLIFITIDNIYTIKLSSYERTPGTVVTVSCHASILHPVGDDVLMCQNNGTWNGTAPVCSSVTGGDTVNATEGDLRLVDGRTNTSGRVEIYHDGEWWTICDDGFGTRDARVVCTQLGFGGKRPEIWPYAPAGTGHILLADLGCVGNETMLTECSHRPWGQHDCRHDDYAGVECDGLSFVEDLRLVGPTERSGRLEVRWGGQWGPVCASGFGAREAFVACRTLGFDVNLAVSSDDEFGRSTDAIQLSTVDCIGSESSLAECSFRGPFGVNNSCEEGRQIGITCTAADGDLRLADGDSNTNGRVEIYYNGEWGTICDEGFGTRDARVVCTQLGFGETRPQVWPYAPVGNGTILLDDIGCAGNEKLLIECHHRPWGEHDCHHRNDAGVECDSLSFVEDLRLVGPSARSGRLEVRWKGQWGPVCASGFGTREALVACRTLGFDVTHAVSRYDEFGRSPNAIHLSMVDCTGSESSLTECSFRGPFGVPGSCEEGHQIGINCIDFQNRNHSRLLVRLNGGSDKSGRLELAVNNVWGTVCNTNFNDNAAKVTCRMMGLQSDYALAYNFQITQPVATETHIWLDEVRCGGSEANLLDCVYGEWDMNNCKHTSDIGVFCADDAHAIHHHQIRLAGSNSTNRGRVEVEYFGIWGKVCDDGWTSSNTKVICSSLYLPHENAQKVAASEYGEGSGPSWLDDIVCIGDERSLFDCEHVAFGQEHCTHGEDVAIICE